MKIFQIYRRTKRRSLPLTKLKTSPAFLKMRLTTVIYYEFGKIFRETISRGCFCLNTLQEIAVYWYDWFYFPVRPIWHSKEYFSAKFLVKRGTRKPCTAFLKKDTIPLYAERQFVMYGLKIVTQGYIKLLVSDNLILFLYHSGINCSIVYG